jgi:AcrR family transcriptional regulator
MGKRGPRRQYDLDQILDAAMVVVLANGIDGLTVARLAQELSAAPSALYRYAPGGKEEILVGLQERAIDALSAEMAHMAALSTPEDLSEEATALLRVLRVFTAYLRQRAAAPERHRLIDAFLSAPDPVLSETQALAINQRLAAVLAVGTQTLDDAVAEGALSPGDSLQRAHVLWAGMHGLDHFYKRDRIQPPSLQVQTLQRVFCEVTLRGMGAQDALNAALNALYQPQP